jgi:hypothetical protein
LRVIPREGDRMARRPAQMTRAESCFIVDVVQDFWSINKEDQNEWLRRTEDLENFGRHMDIYNGLLKVMLSQSVR